MSVTPCSFLRFGLVVTGDTERLHLPKLFRLLVASGLCTFEVIRQTDQRRPLPPAKQIKMTGQGARIPSKDEEEIGLPARRYLQQHGVCGYVLVLDDLEYDWREQAELIFRRYRLALDTMLPAHQRQRAAMFFFVYMLEAYYFANAQAVNTALGRTVLATDAAEDVETLRHPKNELKHLYVGFDEIEHGGQVLGYLDVAHVLADPQKCAALRTLFAWCVKALSQSPYFEDVFSTPLHLTTGRLSPLTAQQSPLS